MYRFPFRDVVFSTPKPQTECGKYSRILVHTLKTSKTGVFNAIKVLNSPPQAKKIEVLVHRCQGGIPPPGVGGCPADLWEISRFEADFWEIRILGMDSGK